MNLLLRIVSIQLPQTVAIIGAIYLAASGADGWGWLIFFAMIFDSSLEVNAD